MRRRSSRGPRESSRARPAGDPALAPAAERAASLLYELRDVAGELRGYLARSRRIPSGLAEVEDRLELYARLKRKHGGSVTAVLEHAIAAAPSATAS